MNDLRNKIIEGDCLTVLRRVPPHTYDLVITSPPYFDQRRYTDDEREIGREPSVDDYLGALVSVFRECVRVTKSSGSVVWNLGDKYIRGSLQLIPYRFADAVQREAGVVLLNQITWAKTNPVPRSYPRRMVGSTEPFFHFVLGEHKYYPERLVGGPPEAAAKPDSKIGLGYFRQIAESGLSPEEKARAVAALEAAIQEVKDGTLPSFRMKIRGRHAPAYGGVEGGRNTQITEQGYSIIRLPGRPVLRDIIECPVETVRGQPHPAVFPASLVRQVVLLTTDPGDLVLDPFLGSGTTAEVCKQAGRDFTGIELSADYAAKARRRVELARAAPAADRSITSRCS